MMKCERCKGDMFEEELIVVGGVVRVKDLSAWHCLNCGRIEYRSKAADRTMVELETTGNPHEGLQVRRLGGFLVDRT